jgi:hypothetical protein
VFSGFGEDDQNMRKKSTPAQTRTLAGKALLYMSFPTVFEAEISRNILTYFLSDITYLKVKTLSGLKKCMKQLCLFGLSYLFNPWPPVTACLISRDTSLVYSSFL